MLRLAPAFVAVLLASASAAQPTAQPDTTALPDGCSYDACALRVEPGWFSRDIVQGVDGVGVGRFGVIDSDLEEAVAGSDYAADQARAYDRSHRLALLSGIAGSALILLSATVAVGDGDEAVSSAASLGGIALGFASVRFQMSAEQALSRAVWEYNRTLPAGE